MSQWILCMKKIYIISFLFERKLKIESRHIFDSTQFRNLEVLQRDEAKGLRHATPMLGTTK